MRRCAPQLEADLEREGPGALYARLRVADPVTAERVDPRNGRRIVRALEVLAQGEATHGAALPDEPVRWRASTVIGLTSPREELVARLDARVERMWSEGLLAEVEAPEEPRARARGHRPSCDRLRAGTRPAGRHDDAGRGDRRDPGADPQVRPSPGVVVQAVSRRPVDDGGRRCRSPADTGSMTSIRAFTLRDTESVIALWQSTGLTKSWNNPHLDIQRKLTVQPELFLVATDADEIIGTVMAGYDGHRGWLYYLASDPMRRGQGIGRALVSAAEDAAARTRLPEGAADGAPRQRRRARASTTRSATSGSTRRRPASASSPTESARPGPARFRP